MPSVPKKTAQTIIDSGNDYLGALKGNQSRLLASVQAKFQAQEMIFPIDTGHGRIKKRTVSISHDLTGIPDFPGLQTLIRVESERAVHRASIIEVSTETRPVRDLLDRNGQTPCRKSSRLLGGRKQSSLYSRCHPSGEDASGIRTKGLVQCWAIARNFALNLYRDYDFQNMAQAQRLAGFNFNILKDLFRMK